MNICSGCRAFSESCSKAQEPEDVTVGLIVGEAILAIHSAVRSHAIKEVYILIVSWCILGKTRVNSVMLLLDILYTHTLIFALMLLFMYLLLKAKQHMNYLYFILSDCRLPTLQVPMTCIYTHAGVVLEQTLARTEMIYTHGLDLISTAPSPFLKHQV